MDSIRVCYFFVVVIVSSLNGPAEGAPAPSAGNDLPANWQELIGSSQSQGQSHDTFQNSGVFEGDIKGVDRSVATDPNALANMAHNAVMDRSQLWKDATIPYTIGSGYTSQQKSVIQGALNDMMQKTCLKFVTRSSERDYITFVNRNAGCSSYVARVGGQQLIDLQEGCIYEFGEVQHEVMHALGFFHEQSRKDRDDFVTIVWSNIQRDNYDQFEKYQSNLLGLPYDYESIMHYGWNYFALNRGKPTIVPKSKATIGNRKAMSSVDVQKINLLYQCKGVAAPSGGGSSRPSSPSRPSTSKGSSILDILFGALGGGSSSGRDEGGRPAPQPQPVTTRSTTSTTQKPSSGGITGAIKSFFSGLFGG